MSASPHRIPYTSLMHTDVKAAAAGDCAAFERLVRSNANLVCSIALTVVSDVTVSEEIAQEVFLEVWSRLKQLRNPKSFRGWIRQITRNLANEHLRRRYRRQRNLDALEQPDWGENAEARLVLYERERSLQMSLDALPTDSREVLVLYCREGNSVRQVAQLLELTESTVRKRMSRARALLRDDVQNRLGDDLRASTPTAAFVAAVMAAVASMPTSAQAQPSLTSGNATRWVAGIGGLGVGAIVAALWAVPPTTLSNSPPSNPPVVASAPAPQTCCQSTLSRAPLLALSSTSHPGQQARVP
ncbi:MAG: sigma-70 family RNA polymerase sigma factor [Proteobacteria bacterium]|jgi:RNA polymerase sigma factor (sigma-70 family)|nr:sigma-70 family RNA polymerase sigma factor [Pseudomonadota bacterium]